VSIFATIMRKIESGSIFREGGREGGEVSGERGKKEERERGAGGGREDRGRRQWQADARLSSLSLCRTTTTSGLRARGRLLLHLQRSPT
jgi:hypothetical protein